MKQAPKVVVLSGLVLLMIVAVVGVLLLGHSRSHAPSIRQPDPWSWSAPPRIPGAATPPAHRTLSALKNLRWQALPDEVAGIFVAPDQRVWARLRDTAELSEEGFQAMIEREYALPDPQFCGAELLLFEPAGEQLKDPTPPGHGRVWFEMMHTANRWEPGDKSWSLLLGYDGTPGHWIKRESIGVNWSWPSRNINPTGWEPRNWHLTREACGLSVQGRTFFVYGGEIDCFDGRTWTSQSVRTAGKENRAPVQLMREPDGKGIVVWGSDFNEAAWRWRDGAWREIRLAVPHSVSAWDGYPHLGNGGMWNATREGLWFSPFAPTSQPVEAQSWLGPYQYRQTFADMRPGIFETDEQGRLFVGADLIWNPTETPGPDPAVLPLVEKWKSARSEDLHQQVVKMAGGVIVREPDGACRLLRGALRAPEPLQDQLPDQQFTAIDHQDSGAIYAIGPGRFGNQIMVYTPGAPDQVTKATAGPPFQFTEAGFLVDEDGDVIAQREHGEIERFDGHAWRCIDGLHGVRARAMQAGRSGVVVALDNDGKWYLSTPDASSSHASLQELVEKNRDAILKGFGDRRLTGRELWNISIAVDALQNIWIASQFGVPLAVLTGGQWVETGLKVEAESENTVVVAAAGTGVYMSFASTHGSYCSQFARVADGKVLTTTAPSISFLQIATTPRRLGPMHAHDGSLWLGADGATRVDPAGAVSRINSGNPALVDAGDCLWLTSRGNGAGQGTVLKIRRPGKPLLPLVADGLTDSGMFGGFWTPPSLFTDKPGSVWACTSAGLRHANWVGDAETGSYVADDGVFVVNGLEGMLDLCWFDYSKHGYLIFAHGNPGEHFLQLVRLLPAATP